MPQASKLPLAVKDARLGLETGIIVRLAHKLIALLMIRDPLSERVHLTRLDAMLAGGARSSCHTCCEARSTLGFSASRGEAMRGLHRQSLAPPAPAPIARRSSFYLAMRILPPEQRQAMYEVYAFCRAVDDIADDGGPRSERVAMLDRWRADMASLYAGRGPTELTKGLCRPGARLRFAAGGFACRHRRHGNGRRSRHPCP